MRSAYRPFRRALMFLLGGLLLCTVLTLSGFALAQFFGGTATTESVCNFGMAKDEASQSCEVPIPFGCEVANFPGTDTPWINVSKGGKTTCQFDESHTDWKTKITGTCGTCKTPQCSARFSVMFVCGGKDAPSQYQPQMPGR